MAVCRHKAAILSLALMLYNYLYFSWSSCCYLYRVFAIVDHIIAKAFVVENKRNRDYEPYHFHT